MIKIAKGILKCLVSHKTNGNGFVGVLESGPTVSSVRLNSISPSVTHSSIVGCADFYLSTI